MVNLRLYPQSGRVSDAENLQFEISGIDSDIRRLRVTIENATNGFRAAPVIVNANEDGKYVGNVRVRILPQYGSSSISIFAYVEKELQNGGYELINICPSIFSITEEKSDDGIVSLSNSFIGIDDSFSVDINGKEGECKIACINDKFFKIIVGKNGVGSVRLRGRDILLKEYKTVAKLPVYMYSSSDNYVKKKFTGKYLNVIPSTLTVHADSIDPRCNPNDDRYVEPGAWIMPSECATPPDGGGGGGGNVVVTITQDYINVSCKKKSTLLSNKSCRVFGSSSVLLNNGLVLHAYLSPDVSYFSSNSKLFNINRIFFSYSYTSVDVEIVANVDVAVEPKLAGEFFTIHVN